MASERRTIALDGTVPDVIKGMGGVLALRNPSVTEWGCRALMNFARVSG